MSFSTCGSVHMLSSVVPAGFCQCSENRFLWWWWFKKKNKKVQQLRISHLSDSAVSSAGSAASGLDSFVQTSPGPSHLLLEEPADQNTWRGSWPGPDCLLVLFTDGRRSSRKLLTVASSSSSVRWKLLHRGVGRPAGRQLPLWTGVHLHNLRWVWWRHGQGLYDCLQPEPDGAVQDVSDVRAAHRGEGGPPLRRTDEGEVELWWRTLWYLEVFTSPERRASMKLTCCFFSLDWHLYKRIETLRCRRCCHLLPNGPDWCRSVVSLFQHFVETRVTDAGDGCDAVNPLHKRTPELDSQLMWSQHTAARQEQPSWHETPVQHLAHTEVSILGRP